MILFRADGNAVIGSGHIMRCLSIADALRDKGYESKFIIADESSLLGIRKRGFETIILHSDYRKTDDELNLLLPVIYGSNASMMVVDSYYTNLSYFKVIHKILPTAYIDDLATDIYPVDLLINYNAYGQNINYAKMYHEAGVDMPRFLLGTFFAPLRKMFQDIPLRTQKTSVSNILVSTGGSDSQHIGLKFINEIQKDNFNVNWHMLVGAMNLDYSKIQKAASEMQCVKIHYDVSDMRSLISLCDIAVSAAGSTMYEIAACGTPMITFALADNQIPGAKAFQEQEMAVYCGHIKNDNVSNIIAQTKQLAKSYQTRCKIGIKMQEQIDGHGAERIAEEIIKIIS